MVSTTLTEKLKNLLIYIKNIPGNLRNTASHSGEAPGIGSGKPKNLKQGKRRNSGNGKKANAFSDFKRKIISRTDSFLERFPEKMRKPIIFSLGGVVVLFIFLVIVIFTVHSVKPPKAVQMSAGPFIPVEDLFIPAEPDYVPEFILEREPRSSWSPEDIQSYWRSPGNSEYWREEIKSAVDKLMEGVP